MQKKITHLPDWMPAKNNLDEMWAFEFLKKIKHSDALGNLKRNPSPYIEALAYAKGSYFSFFFETLISYLLSDDSRDDFESASGFVNLISSEKNHENLISMKNLSNDIFVIVSRQKFYDADEVLFGDFLKAYQIFIEKITLNYNLDVTDPISN